MYKYLTLKNGHPASGSQLLFIKTNVTTDNGGEIIRLNQDPVSNMWNMQYLTGSLSSPMHISRQISDMISQISSSNSQFEETTATEFINAYNAITASFNSKVI